MLQSALMNTKLNVNRRRKCVFRLYESFLLKKNQVWLSSSTLMVLLTLHRV